MYNRVTQATEVSTGRAHLSCKVVKQIGVHGYRVVKFMVFSTGSPKANPF
jgi:hypothetical protein